jgi:lipopolysaccharide export system protein LptA
MNVSHRFRVAAFVAAALMATPVVAAASKTSSNSLLPGANSKEPISIDANKLNYFDKEQKAIYTGNVVAIQGDTKLTCSMMTIYLAKSAPAAKAGAAPPPPADAAGGGVGTANSQVKHMDAVGPVTVVSKTQVATGDRAAYDKEENKVWLFGNVTLSDGGNVTKGDKLTYDLTSGQAVVEVEKSTSRVHGQFIPGSGAADTADKPAAPKKEVGADAGENPRAAKRKSGAESTPKPKP